MALNISGLLPDCGVVAVTLKSQPVPLSVTMWGLPLALSVMVRLPARAPVVVGVMVTLMTQVLEPAVADKVLGLMGHAVAPVLVAAKSPEAAMELIVSGPVPELVSVTGMDALAVVTICGLKVRVLVERVTAGVGAGVPLPLRLTMCGLPLALSVTERLPARAPVAVGVNVTLMVHVFEPAVAGRVLGLMGQADAPVLVAAKSPEAAMELIVSGPVPELVSVTGFAALVVPTC